MLGVRARLTLPGPAWCFIDEMRRRWAHLFVVGNHKRHESYVAWAVCDAAL